MTKSNRIQVYVDDDEQSRIETAAENAGVSVSDYVRQAALDRIEHDAVEGLASEYKVEQRILGIIKQATDEIDATVEEAARQGVEAALQGEPDADDDYANWGN